MCHEDVVQAERVGRERGIATGRALESAAVLEFDLPDRSSRRVRDEQVAVAIEGQAVHDERLGTGRIRRGSRRIDRPGR